MTMLSRNQLIRASAGTGKTWQLSNRFLELIAAGADASQILATTFTRKAAGEILDRVIERLAESALSETAAERNAAAMGRGDLQGPAASELFGRQLSQVIGNINCLQIATLDAFFSQIARAFTLEIGMRPDWRIIEETDMDVLKNEAIQRLLERKDATEIVRLLAKGETDISISSLLLSTIDQLHELYLDSDQAAWEQIQPPPEVTSKELAALHDELVQQSEKTTQKRLSQRLTGDAASILSGHWRAIARSTLLINVLKQEYRFYRSELPPEIIDLYQRISEVVRNLLLNSLAMQNRGAFRVLDAYHQLFRGLEEENAALRFDSVNRRVAGLLDRFDPAQINYRLDQNIHYLLLDEFQDTSLNQWKVLAPFARQAVTDANQGSVFCVGDTKQAIYGWRGGVAELFDRVEQELMPGNAAQLSLNRRSSPIVIAAVNQVFLNAHQAPLSDHLKPAIVAWQSRFKKHAAFHNDYPGYVTLERAGSSEDTGAREQAADRIAKLFHQHPQRSIGVLVRTNRVVNEMIYHLTERGIPASEEGGNPLDDSAAVGLISSLLHLIDHPSDRVALFHIAHSPLRPLLFPQDETWEVIKTRPVGPVVHKWRRAIAEQGLASSIEDWAQQLEPWCTPREFTRLSQLVEMAYAAHQLGDSPSLFRKRIETTQVNEPTAASVRVMTIHQAKGLEFDVVVLPQLDCGLSKTRSEFVAGRSSPTGPVNSICMYVNRDLHPMLPEPIRKSFEAHLSKSVSGELCLLYVAMTRARYGLHLFVTSKAKSTNSDWQAFLLATLSEADGGQPGSGPIEWQLGDPDWDAASGAGSTPADKLQELLGEPPARDIDYRDQFVLAEQAAEPRMLPLASPSQAEGGSSIRVSDLLRTAEQRRALAHGSLIHACFEAVEWLDDDATIDKRRVRQLLIGIEGAAPQNIDATIDTFERMVRQPITRKYLTRSSWAEEVLANRPDQPDLSKQEIRVENERAFAVPNGGGILQGFIDRLVLVGPPDGIQFAHVIDFKTDRLQGKPAAALRQRIDWYRPQVAGYCQAVATTFQLSPDRIQSHLVFVDLDHAEPMDAQLPDARSGD